MKAIIGLDIGTTSTKAVVFNLDGTVRGSHAVSYPIFSEAPGWAEQEPEQLFSAALESVREALLRSRTDGSEVAAVCLSAAMHAVMALNHNGEPLTRLLIWADNRSAEEARQLAATQQGKAIYRRTGTPIHAMSPLAKLLWLKRNRPELVQNTAKFVSMKEYLLYRLFGQFTVDVSLASATGLLNLNELDWDQEALELAGIRRDQLSELRPTTHQLEGLQAAYAEQMGLPVSTPFVLGASDGVLANLGAGAISAGDIAVTVGTSGAVRTIVETPLTDERQRTFCYALSERHWVIGGGTNNGAIVLSWLQGLLYPERSGGDSSDQLSAMLREAATASPGADGLLFLPYLSGERSPLWNTEARGVFLGMNLNHRRPQLIRSAMEGMMMSILSVVNALNDQTGAGKRVLASGGFARSPFLLQLLADMIGYEVAVPRCTEASAFGAAVLGMQSLGLLSDLQDVKSMIEIDEVYTPDQRNTAIYRELFGLYEQTYQRLVCSFEEISSFQRASAKRYGEERF